MPTYTSQPDEATGIDTYLDSASPTTNRGTYAGLYSGNGNDAGNSNMRILIKFDLSSVPITAFINSATLYLTVITDLSSNQRVKRVYRQKRAWTEGGATWNKYDGSNNWQTAGGFGSDDCEQTDIGSVDMAANVAANTEISISLTASAVQEMVRGTFTNNGFMVKTDSEENDAYMFAHSGHATASYRPKLVIEYTVPQNGVPVTYISEFGMI